jgi:hypothetical protein
MPAILGISALFHDNSALIVKGPMVAAAVPFMRRSSDQHFPIDDGAAAVVAVS